MAEDKKKAPVIVIKKITIEGGGHHGGAWKVAFADFMTAMMTFFLVMWLVNQSEEMKKQLAAYFSGPSMVEQMFSSYGAELTLEKLFLDFVNEPLRAVQSFMMPADYNPNLFTMGSRKVVMFEIANQLGQMAKNVEVGPHKIHFEIPDYYLFEKGEDKPSGQFVGMMEKIKLLTGALEDANIQIESFLYVESVQDRLPETAVRVSKNRLDIIQAKTKAGVQSDSVDVGGKPVVNYYKQKIVGEPPTGLIKFDITQKEELNDGRKPRPLEDVSFESKSADTTVYDDFVRRVTNARKKTSKQ